MSDIIIISVSVLLLYYVIKNATLKKKILEQNKDPQLRLVIKIKDPIALAKRESKFARMAIGIAPAFIIKEVYKQLRKEVVMALEEQEVDADVIIMP